MAKPKKHYGKWRIRPIGPDGKRGSRIYDTYEEAMHELQKHEVERREAKYGHRALVQRDRTFNEICDYWLNHKALKRSARHDKSIIERHLRPKFGKLLIRQVGIDQVSEYQKALSSTHDVKTVFNHITLLISLLRMAKKKDWLSVLPSIEKPKVKLVTTDFSYFKTTEDIQRFLSVARSRGENFYALYFTAVMTGMREGELAGLQWSDINFQNRIIMVSKSYDGPTKSDEPRPVPILDPLYDFLIQWKQLRINDWVFPNNAGQMLKPSSRIFQENFQKILLAAGFEKVLYKGKLVPYLVFHDLRHTFASHWVMNSGDIFKLQKILGHQSIQMTMRYAHLAPHAFADDFGRLSALTPRPNAEVVQLASARKP